MFDLCNGRGNQPLPTLRFLEFAAHKIKHQTTGGNIMTTQSMEIASTIIKQLASHPGRLQVMIGAKDFVALKSGVMFRFTGKNKISANHCKIVLNGKDLYDITFTRIHGTKLTTKEVLNDVYCDQLTELFESTTGLYLSL